MKDTQLKYRVVPFKLNKQKTECKAIAVPHKTLDMQDMLREMCPKGSVITVDTAAMVMERFMAVLEENLLAGNGFKHPLFSIQHIIKGTLPEQKPYFKQGRNSVGISFKPGNALEEALSQQRPRLCRYEGPTPVIHEVEDERSGAKNSYLTAGERICIKGVNLKLINPEASKEGIYLCEVNSRKHTKITADRLRSNYPKQLAFYLPHDVPEGKYQVEVVSRMKKGNSTLKKTTFSSILQVIAR